MFDCGIAYKSMKEELYKVDTLLITHSHSDHVKPQTLERIKKEFPRIMICANADVAYRWDVIDKVVGTAPFELSGGRTVTPFNCWHDVPCTGYVISRDGENILYATDTNSVENPIDDKIDYVFLESNYNERTINELRRQYKRGGYDPLEGALRHLSTQKCKEFYYVNRRSSSSLLVELHKSHRFY